MNDSRLQPLVSVIVPVYNSAKYLAEAIDSLREQTLRDIEIIIVDDGSTDESVTVAEQLATDDSRIKFHRLESNQGVGAARNSGMTVASGDYLYFFDSDDRLQSTALEQLTELAREENLDIVYFDAEPFFDTDELEREKSGYRQYYQRRGTYPGVKTGIQLLVEMTSNDDWKPGPPLQLIRRDFMRADEIAFPEGAFHEDNPYSLLGALAAKRVSYLPQALLQRRIREGSIVTSLPTARHVFGLFDAYVRGSAAADLKNHGPNSPAGRAIEWEIRKLADDAQRKRQRITDPVEQERTEALVRTSFAHRDIAELSANRIEVEQYQERIKSLQAELQATRQELESLRAVRQRSFWARARNVLRRALSRRVS